MKIPDWLPEEHRPKRADGVTRRPILNDMVAPLRRFFEIEASSGILLLACTVAALFLANSEWSEAFTQIWQIRVGFSVGEFSLFKPLQLWINDGLMTIFFFVVGLEIKRELVFGELRDPRKAALPAAAALGGMIVPAAIFLALQWGQPGERGWGIPMATDIAFVVGFLALLGSRVPLGLKVLLLTLAIVDDIGAVLVIAVAYTEGLELSYLVLGLIGFVIVRVFDRIGVRAIAIYAVIGAVIWLAFLKSHIHPTVAGVLLGLMTPASTFFARNSLSDTLRGIANQLRQDRDGGDHHEEAVHVLLVTARETVSPLSRLETALHPWVAFVVMPLFALANAGVPIVWSAVADPIAIAVAAGLAVGKPLGIFVFSFLAVRLGLARLPSGVNWIVLLGAGCLAGIGFTMSLFIAALALEGPALQAGKIGTLTGSALSAAVGCVLLLLFLRKPATQTDSVAVERTTAP